jgi:hypothetical protein
VNKTGIPKIHFDCPFDDRVAYEAKARGYLGGVQVEFPDGKRHPVYFYDPVRLAQDLEEETKQGRPFIAEKGMVVLNDITLENMTESVGWLAEHGFFNPEGATPPC